MTLARSDATGQGSLDPAILRFTTSLPIDQALFAADLAGSLAHARMLEEAQLIPSADAIQIRRGLLAIFEDAQKGKLHWPDEEDIHMAVEVELGRRIGESAKRLHTARSRNDQVALDARLHLREEAAEILDRVARLLEALTQKAQGAEGAFLMPAYTHRQRAQPVTVAFLFSAYGQMLARDAAQFAQVLNALDESPLGSGAVSGTSLPIRRERVAELLGFGRITENALDAVGDRDFALDFLFASAKCMVHLSRISQDVVDFASQEFGFIELEDRISFGSSMMPHKRNPDVFELTRGKAGRAIADLVGLMTTLKGLPVGYTRDLQEDKVSYLEAAALARECLDAAAVGICGIRFHQDRMAAALSSGATQATDLAEALVRRGIAFREAYRAVGKLVQAARASGKALDQIGASELAAAAGLISREDLSALSPRGAQEAKEVPGGTGATAIGEQLEALQEAITGARARVAATPRLGSLIVALAR